MKVDVDITSKAAEKCIDAVKEFLQKLIGPPIDEIGLLLGDNVRLWRFKNQIRIVQKADEYIKSKNINTKQISLKILAPLLEGASLEEDEDLQDKWAALLVNYVDSKKNLKTTVFPYLLTQISSNEAKALEHIVSIHNNGMNHVRIDILKKSGNFNVNGVEISNLIRLGLIKEVLKIVNYPVLTTLGSTTGNAQLNEIPNLQATELCNEFLEACKLDNTNSGNQS